MTAFRNRQLQLLVATDVAARGIDVADITHVIHYQLPDEIETYTHRSGRTGRAGKSGVSMVLLTRSEQRRIRGIERIIGRSFERKDLPSGEEICEIQLYHLAETLRNTDENPAVEAYLPAVQDLLEGLDRDALIRKLVAVEFSRFHDFYSRTQDPKPVREDAEDSKRERASASARFFINVGERDGLDWMILKDLIRESLGVSKKQVFRVETKDSFSFFSTEAELATKVLEHFQGLTFNGREVKVEPTGQDEKASRRPGKSGYTGKSSYTGKSGYKGKKKGGKPYQKASGKKYGKGNKHKSRR
jgi:ATP-dependent RNA helicase DeaD